MYRSLVGLAFVACVMLLSAGCNDNKPQGKPTIPGNASVQPGGPTGTNPPGANPEPAVNPEPVPFKDPIRAEYQIGEVAKLCDQSIAEAQVKLDAIAAVAPAERSIDKGLLALERVSADLADAVIPLTFMGYVSTDEKVSSEGSECEVKLGQFNVGIYTRTDIYDAIKDNQGRNAEEKRLLSETLKGFEKNGLKLPAETLAQVKVLKSKLAVLESQFSTNINRDASSIACDEAELAGVPADAMARFKRENGKVIVTTKQPDFVAVSENATNPETRRKMYDAYMNMAALENTKLLTQAVETRRAIAKLMGYATWADYRTDGRMAKDGKTVLEFLNGLKSKLGERTKKDLALMLARKQKDDPKATKIEEWDLRYYSYQLKKETYSVDDEKIRDYFPSELVMKGIFEIYSQLLGVSYVEVLGAKVWAEGVKLYQIIDNKDQKLIGYFYLDMEPRDLKYDHFAAFPLISARLLPNGEYSKPVASVVGNFTPASGGKPSLLNHSEVETAFHEFGHIMHQTLTKAPYASLSGSNVAQDFVEAPSQMLENWVWSSEILDRLSSHYVTGEKLPAALREGMIKAQDFNQGYLNSRQLTFGLFDMSIHTAEGAVDVTETYKQTFRDVIGVEPIENNHFPAAFGHMMGGYDAGYYGYMWSLVYAQDMFTRFEQGGLLSSEVGADYRKWILEKGSMIDALDLARGFLGREPNADAFYRSLGISTSTGPQLR